MKFTALAALIGASSAQLDACTSTDDCLNNYEGKYAEGSCCNSWTVAVMPEDPTWGQFSALWGGEDAVAVGGNVSGCAYPAYVAQSAGEVDETGNVSNYKDLANFWENSTGTKEALSEALGLDAATATVDEWIEAWGSTVATQEGFILTVGCIGNARALAAGIATVAAAVYATL